jgi:hypothetical protein
MLDLLEISELSQNIKFKLLFAKLLILRSAYYSIGVRGQTRKIQ